MSTSVFVRVCASVHMHDRTKTAETTMHSAFHPFRVDKRVVSCNHMVATTSHGATRRLVNVYEVKGGYGDFVG